MKYDKNYLKKINSWYRFQTNDSFLSRHPELESFDMPKTFYFRYLPDSCCIHWAIIKNMRNRVVIYFINHNGRVFDKLEFESEKLARRGLRRCGFDFSTNRYCPFIPQEPIYIKCFCGKKSAPYSKGKLWCSVQRNKKHFDKLENTCIKKYVKSYERLKNWVIGENIVIPIEVYKVLCEKDVKVALDLWSCGDIDVKTGDFVIDDIRLRKLKRERRNSNIALFLFILIILAIIIFSFLPFFIIL